MKSSPWMKESKSNSVGHTPIQPIQQSLRSRFSEGVWRRTMHNENNVLVLFLKSEVSDTMQTGKVLGFGLQLHFLVMIGYCKPYAQSDQHFYSIKPYAIKLNLSTDKQSLYKHCSPLAKRWRVASGLCMIGMSMIDKLSFHLWSQGR